MASIRYLCNADPIVYHRRNQFGVVRQESLCGMPAATKAGDTYGNDAANGSPGRG